LKKNGSSVASLVEDHSYYVQRFPNLLLVITTKKVAGEIVKTADKNLLAQKCIVIYRDTEMLATALHQFLTAPVFCYCRLKRNPDGAAV
jgi:hypothetical protein